jgi:Ni/Co efflux regulator RcnB
MTMKTMLLAAAAVVALPLTAAVAQSVTEVPSRDEPRRERPAEERERPRPPREKDESRVDHTTLAKPAKGARFRIQRGETTIDVRCPDDSQLGECADILFQIMDRMNSNGGHDGNGRDRDRPTYRDDDRW